LSLEFIECFNNYTTEVISELRHLFGEEKIDSRPIKYNNVIMWIDAKQRLHRTNGPAVERENGEREYWNHGEKYGP